MKEIIRIHTNDAPPAIGPYSQCMIAGDFLFTSGQGPLDNVNADVVGETITEQAELTMKNLEAILKEAGTDFTRIVKCNCYLSDMSLFGEFNKVYEKYVVSTPPRTCVAVKDLPKGIKCEVEMIAYLG